MSPAAPSPSISCVRGVRPPCKRRCLRPLPRRRRPCCHHGRRITVRRGTPTRGRVGRRVRRCTRKHARRLLLLTRCSKPSSSRWRHLGEPQTAAATPSSRRRRVQRNRDASRILSQRPDARRTDSHGRHAGSDGFARSRQGRRGGWGARERGGNECRREGSYLLLLKNRGSFYKDPGRSWVSFVERVKSKLNHEEGQTWSVEVLAKKWPWGMNRSLKRQATMCSKVHRALRPENPDLALVRGLVAQAIEVTWQAAYDAGSYDLAWTMFPCEDPVVPGERDAYPPNPADADPFATFMEAEELAAGMSYVPEGRLGSRQGESRAAAGSAQRRRGRSRRTAQEAPEEAAREGSSRCAGEEFVGLAGGANSRNAKPEAVGPKPRCPERPRLGRASALSGRVVKLVWSRNKALARFLRRHYIAGDSTHTGNTRGFDRPRKRMWPAPLLTRSQRSTASAARSDLGCAAAACWVHRALPTFTSGFVLS